MVLSAGREHGNWPRHSDLSFGIALTSSSRSLSEILYRHRSGLQCKPISNMVNWFRNKSGRIVASSRSKAPSGEIESLVNVWCKLLGRRAASIVGRNVPVAATGNSNSRDVKVVDWIWVRVWSKGECTPVVFISSDLSEGNVDVGSGISGVVVLVLMKKRSKFGSWVPWMKASTDKTESTWK